MRIDEFLVSTGYAPTRQKAKRIIKLGLVKVNGKVVTIPSMDITFAAKVEVEGKGLENLPEGYWKLKSLDEELSIIHHDDEVLDLGSSAGGFLLYASEKARKVTGIEISREFEKELADVQQSKPNITVRFENVFQIQPETIRPVDVILNDLTLEPEISVTALKRFLPLLKPGGRILIVLKGVIEKNKAEILLKDVPASISAIIPGKKKEIYVYLHTTL
jgi:23S rRNA (cytidine1920-2'-O)/16S rRNA (cytidine1409-2'-O)-methyltransferase